MTMEAKTYTVALEPNQGHADAIMGMLRREKPATQIRVSKFRKRSKQVAALA